MNTDCKLKLFAGCALLLIALIALQGCGVPLTARDMGQPAPGMGDLHRFESQGYLPERLAGETHLSAEGMGDLHVYEAEQEALLSGRKFSQNP